MVFVPGQRSKFCLFAFEVDFALLCCDPLRNPAVTVLRHLWKIDPKASMLEG